MNITDPLSQIAIKGSTQIPSFLGTLSPKKVDTALSPHVLKEAHHNWGTYSTPPSGPPKPTLAFHSVAIHAHQVPSYLATATPKPPAAMCNYGPPLSTLLEPSVPSAPQPGCCRALGGPSTYRAGLFKSGVCLQASRRRTNLSPRIFPHETRLPGKQPV